MFFTVHELNVFSMTENIEYLISMDCDELLAPDRVLHNGKIVTVDADNSIHEAVAIKNSRIIAVGSDDEIKTLTVRAQQHGIRVCVHSIGDRAIDIALDAFEEAQKQYPRDEMRHRIEHNSICTPKQLKRIKELHAAPASSIGYMWSIGDDYYENFGVERVRWCHPHKSMIEMGIIAGGNCDYPITDGNPMIQIYEAVTRKT